VQGEKDGLSLQREGWSDFDAQEQEAPLASGGKGKDIIIQQPPSVE
jgi:hypothetical protein